MRAKENSIITYQKFYKQKKLAALAVSYVVLFFTVIVWMLEKTDSVDVKVAVYVVIYLSFVGFVFFDLASLKGKPAIYSENEIIFPKELFEDAQPLTVNFSEVEAMQFNTKTRKSDQKALKGVSLRLKNGQTYDFFENGIDISKLTSVLVAKGAISREVYAEYEALLKRQKKSGNFFFYFNLYFILFLLILAALFWAIVDIAKMQ